MRFTKVKYDGKQVHLEWQTPNGDTERIEHKLVSVDAPDASLPDGLEALKPEVLRLLDLPPDYGEDMRVQSVSINYSTDDVMGCVVTCLKKLSDFNAPLVLNTPHLAEDNENGPAMSGYMLDRVDELQMAAAQYVKGFRAQGDMFENEGIAEAVAGLAPKRGSGIDSVTISTDIDGEKTSTTLTADDGERIRRNLRRRKTATA